MKITGTISARQIVDFREPIALMPCQTRQAKSIHIQSGVWEITPSANFNGPSAYSGAALSPRALVSFEARDATTITTAIKPITSVQIALISGFTPSRTSE